MFHLVLLLLPVSAMAYTPYECHYDSEAIKRIYDRFELFKKTKAFDPTDPKIPLERYQFHLQDGLMNINVKINGVYIEEDYKINDDNPRDTRFGHYHVNGGVDLLFKRGHNGTFIFIDKSNDKNFSSSLQSIDAELPSDFEEDYKQVLIDLNAMRKKMFDYQNGLSKEDIELVQLFEFIPLPNGDGFTAQYLEQDALFLQISKQNGNDVISGRLLCGKKEQKYNIVDGKVVLDGEPGEPYFSSDR